MRRRKSPHTGSESRYPAPMGRSKAESLTTVGLFAGIGGIELGLANAGHRARMICEIDPGARAVLEQRFDAEILGDIKGIGDLPKSDLIAAGFPCQDLSQAGRTAGIAGAQSGLISEVFKRIPSGSRGPKWLLLENVPFMLQLQGGQAMRYVVQELESLGFTWAYRVVDARAFGIPQRRRRVLLLASRTEDPRGPLMLEDVGLPAPRRTVNPLCGFYWTEGRRGLGWAVDALPTLKGGSTIGIPSPPAIWDSLDRSISTPDIRDAERLQGFDEDWTLPAVEHGVACRGHRWKLVGNAVSVPLAEWIGRRLVSGAGQGPQGVPILSDSPWPTAAWGHNGKRFAVDVSPFPKHTPTLSLRRFLRHPLKPLSYRAATGFLTRALASSLRFEPGFLADVASHARRMSRRNAA